MTLAILGIVSSIIGFVFWMIRRNAEKSPEEKAFDEHKISAQEVDKIIATGAERSLNEYFEHKLQNIHDNKLRQGDSKNASKEANDTKH